MSTLLEDLTPDQLAVKAGAELLDAQNPGWHERIDLRKLSLGHIYDCVLGQLYGRFGLGLLALFPHDVYGGPDYTQGTAYGFDGALARENAWKQEIKARISASAHISM